MSKLAEIEALLFVAGEDGLRVRQLADLLSIPPTGVIQSLEKLAEKYRKDEDSSLVKLLPNKISLTFCGNIQKLRSIKVYQELPWRLYLLLLISNLLQELK